MAGTSFDGVPVTRPRALYAMYASCPSVGDGAKPVSAWRPIGLVGNVLKVFFKLNNELGDSDAVAKRKPKRHDDTAPIK